MLKLGVRDLFDVALEALLEAYQIFGHSRNVVGNTVSFNKLFLLLFFLWRFC